MLTSCFRVSIPLSLYWSSHCPLIGVNFSPPSCSSALQASSLVLCPMALGDHLGQKGSEVWHPLMPASSSAMCAASGTMWLRSFFRAQIWALQKRQSGLGRKLASIAPCGRSMWPACRVRNPGGPSLFPSADSSIRVWRSYPTPLSLLHSGILDEFLQTYGSLIPLSADEVVEKLEDIFQQEFSTPSRWGMKEMPFRRGLGLKGGLLFLP